MLELILGGARSGKSSLALKRAAQSGCSVVVIATARADDLEMRERIARHRAERPPEWKTIEAPVHLAQAIDIAAQRDTFIVIDCLTLWLANVLYPASAAEPFAPDDDGWQRERDALLQTLAALACDAVLVSNEIGLGLVPETAVGRRFRDEQGRLNQQIAALCDHVTFVAAGLPLILKAPT